jgi:AraC family transcriptional regulator of adaptative response/methylated-DNA-[protein]-cysteine methyltransferase
MNRRQRLAVAGSPPSDEQWGAIEGRAPEAGTTWLLVVASTGIVCRPGCPARTPGRGNVRIVGSLEDALEAGARPCLRCHPERPEGRAGEPSMSDGEAVAAAVASLSEAIEADADPPSDVALAVAVGLPERRLRDAFRAALGVTPRSWVSARRAERLRTGLNGRAGAGVLGALFDAGYGSSSSGYEAAAAELGMPPGRYRSGGAGERIRWTAVAIPDGVALIAATSRGICAVRLADGPGAEASLEGQLRAEFPRAAVVRDDKGLARVASMVADLAAGNPRPEVESLPLDVRATAFRRRVWEALRRIPFGETRSYGEIAAAVGAPGAARAVGSACAANPVAIVVPCHRVIGSDGSMHGYAYGLERKRLLLDAEHATPGEPRSRRVRPVTGQGG